MMPRQLADEPVPCPGVTRRSFLADTGMGFTGLALGAMLARAELRAVFDELLLRGDRIALGPARVTYPNLTTNMSIYDEMAITLAER